MDEDKLPGFQMLVLCIINFNEAVQGNIIWPFIPFLVQKFGATEETIGTYVGVLASSFFLAQLLFVAAWERLADRIGRRRVLLLGCVGTTFTMALFGFSTSYNMALVCRFLTGALNANVAVAKVYTGEITNRNTQARAFSWLSFTWGLGTVIAPAIGGYLADPAAQYPGSSIAALPLVQSYPYVLPSLVSAAMSLTALALGMAYLPETNAWLRRQQEETRQAAKAARVKKQSADRVTSRTVPVEDVKGEAELQVKIEEDVADEDEEESAPMLQPTLGVADDAVQVPLDGVQRSESRDSRSSGRKGQDETGLRTRSRAVTGAGPGMVGNAEVQFDGNMEQVVTGIVRTLSKQGRPPTGRGVNNESIRAGGDEDPSSGARGTAGTGVLVGQGTAPSVSSREALPPPLPSNASTLQILSDRGVGWSILNYTLLSLAQIIFDELQPVFCKTAIEHGGLGWSSADVGSLQIVQGAVQIVFQLFLFHRLAGAYPLSFLFMQGMWPMVPLFAAWPAIGRLAGSPPILWAVISVGIAIKASLMTVAFTSIMIMINNSARGSHLGMVTGVAQGAASAVRALGPTLGGSMYSAAVSMQGLGSATARLHVVYTLIALVASAAFATSFHIPSFCNAPPLAPQAMGAGKAGGEDWEDEEQEQGKVVSQPATMTILH